jgi:hypothetical protein
MPPAPGSQRRQRLEVCLGQGTAEVIELVSLKATSHQSSKYVAKYFDN